MCCQISSAEHPKVFLLVVTTPDCLVTHHQMKRGTILDYFPPTRKTASRRSRSISPSPAPPPYPLIDSNRKENDFTTFYTSSDLDYPYALSEIQNGQKTSHWIWYILPQLASLGSSPQAKWYGIKSLPEAKKYLNDPILGKRLIEICQAIHQKLFISRIPIRTLMGGGIDAMKLLSSMTLFYFVSYQTNHEILFTSLRIYCEQKLKRQDDKTILFCEESLTQLGLPIPLSHQEQEQDHQEMKKTNNSISSTPTPTPPSSQSAASEMMEVMEPSSPNSSSSSSSYPLLSSTRIENDFTLFLRDSPSRYLSVLAELQQPATHTTTTNSSSSRGREKRNEPFSPWLWYLLPRLVTIPEDNPNDFYFGMKSFPECQKFYQHEILGFQIFSLLGALCLRLEDHDQQEKEQKEDDLVKVIRSPEHLSKLLSCVTLFCFVNETISDDALPYLHHVHKLEIMKRKGFQTPKDLLQYLKMKCEQSLHKIDQPTIEFCQQSIEFLLKNQQSGHQQTHVNEESCELREATTVADKEKNFGPQKESSEPKCGNIETDGDEKSETTDVEEAPGGEVRAEQEECKEHDDDDDEKNGEEDDVGEESVDTLSVDSQSHEYNDCSYQMEGMELQTPPDGEIDDEAEELPSP
jgi:uncharacterized protein (DUF1810 family)